MESRAWLFKRWISLCNRCITTQRISIGETNCTIHWLEIDPLDSTIQPLNNQGLFKVKQNGEGPIRLLFPHASCNLVKQFTFHNWGRDTLIKLFLVGGDS